jgi:hypothetical protein
VKIEFGEGAYERIGAFKRQSSIMLEKYGNGSGQYYQYENAISPYLWLRYPDNDYKTSGNKIGVHTLDLNIEFPRVREQPDGIAKV